MGYKEAVNGIWRHTGGALSDDGAILREIVRYATLAPSGHNTQPWRFRVERRSIAILPDRSRHTPVVDPDDHHLYVSLGCAIENLVQAARALGFASHPESDGATGETTVALEPTSADESPLFKAIPYRQCTRREYDGARLSNDELRLLEAVGTGHGVRVLLLTEREAMEKVLDYVVQGNTMQMKNPAFVHELALLSRREQARRQFWWSRGGFC